MDVVERLIGAARLAGFAQELVLGHLPDQRLLDFGGAFWRHADAAEGHRGAGDLAGFVLDQECRRGDNCEVAVTP